MTNWKIYLNLLKHKWFSNVMLVVFSFFFLNVIPRQRLGNQTKNPTDSHRKKPHVKPFRRKRSKPRGFHETPRFRFRCGVIRPLWRAAWKPSWKMKPIFGAARWWWIPGLLSRTVVVNGWQWLNMFQKMVFLFSDVCFLFFFEADIVEKHIILFGRCDFWSDFDLSHRTAIDGIIPELYPVVVAFYCIYYSMYSFVTCRGFIMVPMPGNSTVCSFPSLM